jgi:antitoxin component of MazEF toxin-antitoxin module
METVASYMGNSLGFRVSDSIQEISHITDNTRVLIEAEPNKIIITRIEEKRRHRPISERIKDWDGQPYELTDEDKVWLNMPAVGEEIEC